MHQPQPERLERRGLALVAFAAAVTMMARLWEGDIFRDEVLYAAIAKQILVRHEWLNLYFGSDPYWRKPPLLFWLAATAYRIGGISTFTAKVFPALFGVGSCVTLYLLARRLTGARVALVAGLILATTPRFVRTSATFRLDSGVTFFSLGALFLYVRGTDTRAWRDFALAGLAWGLAVMAKGPFGLTGPYLFLIYLAVQRDLRVAVSPRFLASVAIGAAVCLPWHVYQVAHWGTGFLDVYISEQVVDRVTGKLWPGPPASYLGALVRDDWPWLAFLALGIVTAAGRARRGDRNALYVLAWAAGFLLLLYASEGRRARYLHQFYPAAAVLSAMGLTRLLSERWNARLPGVAARLFGVVAIVLLLVPIPLHSQAEADLRALRPALDVLAPHDRSPIAAYRSASPTLRAACLFYLDRDLQSVEAARSLPPTDGGIVLTAPAYAADLEAAGFTRAYANQGFVLLRRGGAPLVAAGR
jgi:4-amino-4-deoxy-L-arabinose transferase-like glycosyltransferase